MIYRRDIDGLRAIAILLVTVFHFDLFSVGKAGFIGVDVFFVISGFLITSIIVRDLRAGNFAMGHFLYRRARRLYPAMLATLVVYLGVGYLVFLPDLFHELATEALLSQLYVVNFYFWRSVNYFGLQVGSVPLLHMWSLAIEEQFYLLFPIFCLVIYKLRPGWLFGAIVVVTVASFLLGLFATPWKPWAAFYLLPTRAWELSLGAVLACLMMDRPPQGAWLRFAGVLGLGLICVGLFVHTPATGVPGWFSLLPAVGAALVLLGGAPAKGADQADNAVARLLSFAPMVWIGKISYPLYLVHWPILIILKDTVMVFSLPWKLFGFLLSFVLAWMIYAWVEAPIRSGRVLTAPRRFLGALGLGTGLLVGCSALIMWQQGFPQRLPAQSLIALSYADDSATRFLNCEDRIQGSGSPCLLGAPDVVPDILVFGDSHANAFAHGVDLWLARNGRAGVFSYSNGCLPVQNMGEGRCVAQAQAALRYAESNPSIKTIMLMSIWRQPYGDGMPYQGRWTDGAVLEAAFTDELQQTVSAFVAADKQVILVEPFFGAAGHVPRRLAKNLAFGRNWPLDKDLSEHRDEFAKLYAAFDVAVTAGAQRISLIDDFCTQTLCQSTLDGLPIFSDGNHLADWMSPRLSLILEREITP